MGFGKKRSKNVGVGAITTNKKKLFAEGGMMDDGKSVDPVSGNDVPVGSLAEEVRDDVDAKLSPGEFVFPADVVRFIGLERLMKMRDQAKQGLTRMNDIGQMGNAEDVGEASDDSFEEDDDFEGEIDNIMKEVDQEETGRQTEKAFNTGGFVNASYYDIEKAPKNPALDIRFFKDSEGKDFYMPFINGKPMKPMPNGAVPTITPVSKTTDEDEKDEEVGGAGVIDVIAGTRDLTGALTPNIPGGDVGTSPAAIQQQQIEESKNAGAGSGISGVYTGSNIADFGKPDMIYNPGGSGPAGEVTLQDLHSGITSSDVKLATTIASSVASAMGIPGIVTLPMRLAINKFGADKYNEWIGKVNQETFGRAGGFDTSTIEGKAGAASQIDRAIDPKDSRPAATSGAIGTGSIAAQASAAVSDALKGTGLSDTEIGNLSQRAANAVVSGIDMNTAVNNAKNAAVNALQEKFSDQFGLANVTRKDIVNTVFNNVRGTEELSGSWMQTPDLSANLPSAVAGESSGTIQGSQDFENLEGTMGGGLGDADEFTKDFYETDERDVGDFWGTMDESSKEEEDFGGFGATAGPTYVTKNPFRKKETKRK